MLLSGSQQTGLVPAVRLRNVCDQFPVRLVGSVFFFRTLLDHSVSAEEAGAVSTETSKVSRRRHDHHCNRPVQLRHLDVNCGSVRRPNGLRGTYTSSSSHRYFLP